MHRKQRSGIAEIFAIAFIAGFVFVAFCIVASFVFMMTRKGGYHEENGAIYWCGWSAASGDSRAWVTDDCEHFEKINFSYAKDSRFVYCGEEKIEGADPGSFELISGGPYAKDKNAVYCKESLVHDADPKSFRIIKMPYARDDQNVFNGTFRMKVDDPSSFEVIGEPNDNFTGVYLFSDRNKWKQYISGEIRKDDTGYYGRANARCSKNIYRNYRIRNRSN